MVAQAAWHATSISCSRRAARAAGSSQLAGQRIPEQRLNLQGGSDLDLAGGIADGADGWVGYAGGGVATGDSVAGGQSPRQAVLSREKKRLPFLADKLREDLREGYRIFVVTRRLQIGDGLAKRILRSIELEFGEVARDVLVVDGTVGSCDGGLDVAERGVDPFECRRASGLRS